MVSESVEDRRSPQIGAVRSPSTQLCGAVAILVRKKYYVEDRIVWNSAISECLEDRLTIITVNKI